MRFLFLVFLLIFTINPAAQSPAVAKLFSDGTQHANANRFEEALESYKTALLMAENEYADAAFRARVQYNLGVCHLRLDQFDLSVTRFKAAILLKRDYTDAHHALGIAKARRADWKSATPARRELARMGT